MDYFCNNINVVFRIIMIKIYSCYCLFDLALFEIQKNGDSNTFFKEICIQFCSGHQISYSFDSIRDECVV